MTGVTHNDDEWQHGSKHPFTRVKSGVDFNSYIPMIEDLLNMLFPERCIECGKQSSALCAICERTITTRPVALSGTTATLFDYRNPTVKKAIWALKYSRRRALGKYFGTALYREFFKQLAHTGHKENEDIIVIPVPASAKAMTVRGYNHAGVIAKTIVEAGNKDGLRLRLREDILYKKKEVTPQARTRTRSDRKKNVENVFAINNEHAIIGKTIILIDDVITTGATIASAKRAIKEHNPKRILAIGVAH
jgi:ComF family protein